METGYFNPRSPCGERLPARHELCHSATSISIHAPRVGSDRVSVLSKHQANHFNPRSPCGERRSPLRNGGQLPGFQSTLPVWGATPVIFLVGRLLHISIHAPRVGSDPAPLHQAVAPIFQSTLPVWGATSPSQLRHPQTAHFNPCSPCGERRTALRQSLNGLRFQSMLPVWGATHWIRRRDNPLRYFNPCSPCGERHGKSG